MLAHRFEWFSFLFLNLYSSFLTFTLFKPNVLIGELLTKTIIFLDLLQKMVLSWHGNPKTCLKTYLICWPGSTWFNLLSSKQSRTFPIRVKSKYIWKCPQRVSKEAQFLRWFQEGNLMSRIAPKNGFFENSPNPKKSVFLAF